MGVIREEGKSGFVAVFEQGAGDGDDAAGGDCRDGCLERFGLAFGEPVIAGDADEDAKRFADWQVVHERL